MATVKVTFGPEDRKPVQGDLFAPGRPWLSAAECWCAAEDLALIRWSIDQKFNAGGLWYAVTWNEDTAEWDITPEVDSEGDR